MKHPVATTKNCPCCQAPVVSGDVPPVWVELTLNKAIRWPDEIHLRPRSAEILSVLVKAWPSGVNVEALAYQLDPYAGMARKTVETHICLLRRAIKPLGVNIQNHEGGFYALEDAAQPGDSAAPPLPNSTGPVSTGPVPLGRR